MWTNTRLSKITTRLRQVGTQTPPNSSMQWFCLRRALGFRRFYQFWAVKQLFKYCLPFVCLEKKLQVIIFRLGGGANFFGRRLQFLGHFHFWCCFHFWCRLHFWCHLHFWGRLHFWGLLHFWGCHHFWGRLHSWGHLHFDVVFILRSSS